MLIFVRHGATDFNVQGRWMGGIDAPLNHCGIQQARNVAAQLASYSISRIYTSPLIRAYSTAVEIQRQQQLAPIVVIDELRERSLDVFEGMEKSESNHQKMMCSNGIESLQLLARRLNNAFSQMVKDEVVVVVSHSAVFRCLVSELGYSPASKLDRLNNGQYVELREPLSVQGV